MKRSLLIVACVGVVACSSPTQPTSPSLDTPLPIAAGVGLPPRADAPRAINVDETISVTPSEYLVHGGVQTILGEIEAPADVQWRLSSDEPWITVLTTSGVGSGTFTVELDSNLCNSFMRQGSLRVAPGNTTIPIMQDGSDLGAC